MDKDAAEMLVGAVETATNIAIDSRNKLTAFEALLQKRDPNLFQEYSKILENVRANPPTYILPISFATLLSKFVRPDR